MSQEPVSSEQEADASAEAAPEKNPAPADAGPQDKSPGPQPEVGEAAEAASASASAAATGVGRASASASDSDADVYHVKWIRHRGQSLPVVTQNVNGPCPLLAIANTLLLRGTLQLPAQCAYITSHDLTQRLGETLVTVTDGGRHQRQGQGSQAAAGANLDQIVSDSLALFPKLQTGLDINIRFSGYSEFEYTPELDMFDRFSIELVHGWVLDPQQCDVRDFIASLTYNQLVEKIITAKSGDDQELMAQALAAEDFLDSNCNQLTVYGLMQLTESLTDGALCVLFRNNHFSTLMKHQSRLYLLVTDQGFLHQPDVVWETLDNVDNDSSFVNADFRAAEIEAAAGYPTQSPSGNAADQVERDRQLAMALQNQNSPAGRSAETDEQLALQLQREEEQLYQQQHQQRQPQPQPQQRQQQLQQQQQHQRHRQSSQQPPPPPPPPPSQRHQAAGGNRRSSDSSCACL